MRAFLVFALICVTSALHSRNQHVNTLEDMEDEYPTNFLEHQIIAKEKTLAKRCITSFLPKGITAQFTFSNILKKFTYFAGAMGFDTTSLNLLQKLYDSAFAKDHLLYKRKVLNHIIKTCNFIMSFLPEEPVQANPQLIKFKKNFVPKIPKRVSKLVDFVTPKSKILQTQPTQKVTESASITQPSTDYPDKTTQMIAEATTQNPSVSVATTREDEEGLIGEYQEQSQIAETAVEYGDKMTQKVAEIATRTPEIAETAENAVIKVTESANKPVKERKTNISEEPVEKLVKASEEPLENTQEQDKRSSKNVTMQESLMKKSNEGKMTENSMKDSSIIYIDLAENKESTSENNCKLGNCTDEDQDDTNTSARMKRSLIRGHSSPTKTQQVKASLRSDNVLDNYQVTEISDEFETKSEPTSNGASIVSKRPTRSLQPPDDTLKYIKTLISYENAPETEEVVFITPDNIEITTRPYSKFVVYNKKHVIPTNQEVVLVNAGYNNDLNESEDESTFDHTLFTRSNEDNTEQLAHELLKRSILENDDNMQKLVQTTNANDGGHNRTDKPIYNDGDDVKVGGEYNLEAKNETLESTTDKFEMTKYGDKNRKDLNDEEHLKFNHKRFTRSVEDNKEQLAHELLKISILENDDNVQLLVQTTNASDGGYNRTDKPIYDDSDDVKVGGEYNLETLESTTDKFEMTKYEDKNGKDLNDEEHPKFAAATFEADNDKYILVDEDWTFEEQPKIYIEEKYSVIDENWAPEEQTTFPTNNQEALDNRHKYILVDDNWIAKEEPNDNNYDTFYVEGELSLKDDDWVIDDKYVEYPYLYEDYSSIADAEYSVPQNLVDGDKYTYNSEDKLDLAASETLLHQLHRHSREIKQEVPENIAPNPFHSKEDMLNYNKYSQGNFDNLDLEAAETLLHNIETYHPEMKQENEPQDRSQNFRLIVVPTFKPYFLKRKRNTVEPLYLPNISKTEKKSPTNPQLRNKRQSENQQFGKSDTRKLTKPRTFDEILMGITKNSENQKLGNRGMYIGPNLRTSLISDDLKLLSVTSKDNTNTEERLSEDHILNNERTSEGQTATNERSFDQKRNNQQLTNERTLENEELGNQKFAEYQEPRVAINPENGELGNRKASQLYQLRSRVVPETQKLAAEGNSEDHKLNLQTIANGKNEDVKIATNSFDQKRDNQEHTNEKTLKNEEFGNQKLAEYQEPRVAINPENGELSNRKASQLFQLRSRVVPENQKLVVEENSEDDKLNIQTIANGKNEDYEAATNQKIINGRNFEAQNLNNPRALQRRKFQNKFAAQQSQHENGAIIKMTTDDVNLLGQIKTTEQTEENAGKEAQNLNNPRDSQRRKFQNKFTAQQSHNESGAIIKMTTDDVNLLGQIKTTEPTEDSEGKEETGRGIVIPHNPISSLRHKAGPNTQIKNDTEDKLGQEGSVEENKEAEGKIIIRDRLTKQQIKNKITYVTIEEGLSVLPMKTSESDLGTLNNFENHKSNDFKASPQFDEDNTTKTLAEIDYHQVQNEGPKLTSNNSVEDQTVEDKTRFDGIQLGNLQNRRSRGDTPNLDIRNFENLGLANERYNDNTFITPRNRRSIIVSNEKPINEENNDDITKKELYQNTSTGYKDVLKLDQMILNDTKLLTVGGNDKIPAKFTNNLTKLTNDSQKPSNVTPTINNSSQRIQTSNLPSHENNTDTVAINGQDPSGGITNSSQAVVNSGQKLLEHFEEFTTDFEEFKSNFQKNSDDPKIKNNSQPVYDLAAMPITSNVSQLLDNNEDLTPSESTKSINELHLNSSNSMYTHMNADDLEELTTDFAIPTNFYAYLSDDGSDNINGSQANSEAMTTNSSKLLYNNTEKTVKVSTGSKSELHLNKSKSNSSEEDEKRVLEHIMKIPYKHRRTRSTHGEEYEHFDDGSEEYDNSEESFESEIGIVEDIRHLINSAYDTVNPDFGRVRVKRESSLYQKIMHSSKLRRGLDAAPYLKNANSDSLVIDEEEVSDLKNINGESSIIAGDSNFMDNNAESSQKVPEEDLNLKNINESPQIKSIEDLENINSESLVNVGDEVSNLKFIDGELSTTVPPEVLNLKNGNDDSSIDVVEETPNLNINSELAMTPNAQGTNIKNEKLSVNVGEKISYLGSFNGANEDTSQFNNPVEGIPKSVEISETQPPIMKHAIEEQLGHSQNSNHTAQTNEDSSTKFIDGVKPEEASKENSFSLTHRRFLGRVVTSMKKTVEKHINYGNASVILIYPEGYDEEDLERFLHFMKMEDANATLIIFGIYNSTTPVSATAKSEENDEEVSAIIHVSSQINSEDNPRDVAVINQASSNQASSNQASSNQASANQASSNQGSANQASANQASSNQASSKASEVDVGLNAQFSSKEHNAANLENTANTIPTLPVSANLEETKNQMINQHPKTPLSSILSEDEITTQSNTKSPTTEFWPIIQSEISDQEPESSNTHGKIVKQTDTFVLNFSNEDRREIEEAARNGDDRFILDRVARNIEAQNQAPHFAHLKNFKNLTELMKNVILNINNAGNFAVTDLNGHSRKFVQVVIHKSLIIKDPKEAKNGPNLLPIERKKRNLGTEIFSGAIGRFRQISPSFQGFSNIGAQRFNIPLPQSHDTSSYYGPSRYPNLHSSHRIPCNNLNGNIKHYSAVNNGPQNIKYAGYSNPSNHLRQIIDSPHHLNRNHQNSDLSAKFGKTKISVEDLKQSEVENSDFSFLPHFEKKQTFSTQDFTGGVLFIFKSLPLFDAPKPFKVFNEANHLNGNKIAHELHSIEQIQSEKDVQNFDSNKPEDVNSGFKFLPHFDANHKFSAVQNTKFGVTVPQSFSHNAEFTNSLDDSRTVLISDVIKNFNKASGKDVAKSIELTVQNADRIEQEHYKFLPHFDRAQQFASLDHHQAINHKKQENVQPEIKTTANLQFDASKFNSFNSVPHFSQNFVFKTNGGDNANRDDGGAQIFTNLAQENVNQFDAFKTLPHFQKNPFQINRVINNNNNGGDANEGALNSGRLNVNRFDGFKAVPNFGPNTVFQSNPVIEATGNSIVKNVQKTSNSGEETVKQFDGFKAVPNFEQKSAFQKSSNFGQENFKQMEGFRAVPNFEQKVSFQTSPVDNANGNSGGIFGTPSKPGKETARQFDGLKNVPHFIQNIAFKINPGKETTKQFDGFKNVPHFIQNIPFTINPINNSNGNSGGILENLQKSSNSGQETLKHFDGFNIVPNFEQRVAFQANPLVNSNGLNEDIFETFSTSGQKTEKKFDGFKTVPHLEQKVAAGVANTNGNFQNPPKIFNLRQENFKESDGFPRVPHSGNKLVSLTKRVDHSNGNGLEVIGDSQKKTNFGDENIKVTAKPEGVHGSFGQNPPTLAQRVVSILESRQKELQGEILSNTQNPLIFEQIDNNIVGSPNKENHAGDNQIVPNFERVANTDKSQDILVQNEKQLSHLQETNDFKGATSKNTQLPEFSNKDPPSSNEQANVAKFLSKLNEKFFKPVPTSLVNLIQTDQFSTENQNKNIGTQKTFKPTAFKNTGQKFVNLGVPIIIQQKPSLAHFATNVEQNTSLNNKDVGNQKFSQETLRPTLQKIENHFRPTSINIAAPIIHGSDLIRIQEINAFRPAGQKIEAHKFVPHFAEITPQSKLLNTNPLTPIIHEPSVIQTQEQESDINAFRPPIKKIEQKTFIPSFVKIEPTRNFPNFRTRAPIINKSQLSQEQEQKTFIPSFVEIEPTRNLPNFRTRAPIINKSQLSHEQDSDQFRPLIQKIEPQKFHPNDANNKPSIQPSNSKTTASLDQLESTVVQEQELETATSKQIVERVLQNKFVPKFVQITKISGPQYFKTAAPLTVDSVVSATQQQESNINTFRPTIEEISLHNFVATSSEITPTNFKSEAPIIANSEISDVQQQKSNLNTFRPTIKKIVPHFGETTRPSNFKPTSEIVENYKISAAPIEDILKTQGAPNIEQIQALQQTSGAPIIDAPKIHGAQGSDFHTLQQTSEAPIIDAPKIHGAQDSDFHTLQQTSSVPIETSATPIVVIPKIRGGPRFTNRGDVFDYSDTEENHLAQETNTPQEHNTRNQKWELASPQNTLLSKQEAKTYNRKKIGSTVLAFGLSSMRNNIEDVEKPRPSSILEAVDEEDNRWSGKSAEVEKFRTVDSQKLQRAKVIDGALNQFEEITGRQLAHKKLQYIDDSSLHGPLKLTTVHEQSDVIGSESNPIIPISNPKSVDITNTLSPEIRNLVDADIEAMKLAYSNFGKRLIPKIGLADSDDD